MKLKNVIAASLLTLFTSAVLHSEETTPTSKAAFSEESIEWFEREVRPVLSEYCSSCHSQSSGSSKGGLSLDSREALLNGGDSGPAIVPGKPDESLLIEAIRRESYEMPPDKALSKRHQKILEAWVEKGAPWPAATPDSSTDTDSENWLEARRRNHWAWQPIQATTPPTVAGDNWSTSPIDQFIIAKLHAEGLSPAPPASTEVQRRRLAFDLTGLPPLPADLTDANTSFAESQQEQYIAYVDRLMSSAQFGVRWGRHWLDLVRYAETLGHEFDFPIRHAWQYRDAVMDSLNTDVAYDQFVREHIAGDLLESPRKHPTSDVNQSLALTGFWFLGDSVHAPTDIQNDWALRVDNQIDVVSKAFMGMTVACARCHDHKFDAIGVEDYYGLAGIAESTRRVFSVTDPHDKIGHHNWKTQRAQLEADETAAKLLRQNTVSKEALSQWLSQTASRVAELEKKQQRQELPIHSPFVLLRTVNGEDFQAELATLKKELQSAEQKYTKWKSQSPLLADFSRGVPEGWRVLAVPSKSPVQLPKNPYTDLDSSWWSQSQSAPLGFEWYSASGTNSTPLPALSGRFSSRKIGLSQVVTLQSPRFEVTHNMVCLKMRGEQSDSALVIDNYFMNEVHQLLFKDTRKSIKQKDDSGWVVHAGDLKKYVGEQAYISLEDKSKGWFEVQEVRLSNSMPPKQPSSIAMQIALQDWTSPEQMIDALATRIASALDSIHADDKLIADENIALLRSTLRQAAARDEDSTADAANFSVLDADGIHSIQDLATQLRELDRVTPSPTLLLTAMEGDPRDTAVAIRGNPHQRGELVPRTCFVSFSTRTPGPTSTGRLELAESLTQTDHPLTARVIVNRVWHYMMGHGLVRSPDNFGVLGGRPTHPELLDYLANELIAHNWSVKWLVREIALSQTYRMSSQPSDEQRELDADGSLWSHRSVRRLSAESVRDTLMSISGQLDSTIGGPSVPVYLTDQMTGRGRPRESGPLDGNGRRSVFIEVRRNFLDPFMMAFDFPMPSTTTGRRTQSNVPAQALGLMNDPLVIELAKRWVAQTNSIDDPTERIEQMIRTAFNRAPARQELEYCERFVSSGGDEAWLDLAHVLINSKEFTFLR